MKNLHAALAKTQQRKSSLGVQYLLGEGMKKSIKHKHNDHVKQRLP